jgi:hypothetical protein
VPPVALTSAAMIAWSGQRLFASPSSLDLAVMTVLGAIAGPLVVAGRLEEAAAT